MSAKWITLFLFAVLGYGQAAFAQDRERLLRSITNGLKTCGFRHVEREGSLFRVVDRSMAEFDLDDIKGIAQHPGAFSFRCEAFGCVRNFAPQLGGRWIETSPSNLVLANCGSYSDQIGEAVEYYLERFKQ